MGFSRPRSKKIFGSTSSLSTGTTWAEVIVGVDPDPANSEYQANE